MKKLGVNFFILLALISAEVRGAAPVKGPVVPLEVQTKFAENIFNEVIDSLDHKELAAKARALEENLKKEKTNSPESKSDEMVFIDLSTNEKDNLLIPETVQRAIEREMIKKSTTNYTAAKSSKFEMSSQSVAQLLAAPQKKLAPQKGGTFQTVSAYAVKINSGITGPVKGFDFVSAFDDQREFDNNDGEVLIEEPLQNKYGTYRGKILALDLVVSTSDFLLEKEDSDFQIPMFDRENLFQFFDREELKAQGGLLLIDLGETIESTDIDSNFEAKFLLDDNFKVVTRDDDYRYEFYVGVEVKNTLVHIIPVDGEPTQKLVFIEDQELYFDDLRMRKSEKFVLELYEERVLSKVATELDVDEDYIKQFNSDFRAKGLAPGLFEFDLAKRPLSMRNYFELSHLTHQRRNDGKNSYPILLGTWGGQKAVLPSREFVDYVLEAFDLQDKLQDRCLVQINIGQKSDVLNDDRRSIKEVLASGIDRHGHMNSFVYYLDSDGLFSDVSSKSTVKAFILGEGQGSFSIKVTYDDDKVDYLQSYCDSESYIVESL